MSRIFLIDDEPFYYKLISPVLKGAGYELDYARTGYEGLSKLQDFKADVIILDVRLPDLTGFQILERLRQDPRFSSTPVIFVTAQHELEDKLKAFELGADDYLEKPFQPEELVARLSILMRRGQAMKIIQQVESEYEITSTMVAIHSLRGGVGCSSLAVNLALAFHRLWGKSTVLVDGVLTAGQVALMLDYNPRLTWEDFTDIAPESIDKEVIEQLAQPHESGLRLVASPKFPIATDSFTYEFTHAVMQNMIHNHEFIVVDCAHDFSDMTIEILNLSSYVILLLAPEMASLRAAVAALDIYDRLGFPHDKIKVTLNQNTNLAGIRHPQIEKVLDRPVDLSIPYGGSEILRAINFGEPFLLKNPESPLSVQLEDTAYHLANDFHKNIPPATPSATWKRVTKRVSTSENT